MDIFSQYNLSPTYVLLSLLLVSLVVAWARSRSHHLDHVPGPFISRYTDAYRAYLAWKYPNQDVNLYMKVHAKYGDVVRLGPRSVSVLDPLAVPSIYGIKARFHKGPNVTAFNVPGIPRSLLATLDENEHARYRRPIQNAYSLSNLKGYEPYVNEVIGKLATVLDRHVRDQTQINLSLWVYFWSYDVIGKITFGSMTGYLEKGSDFNRLIQRQKEFFEYVNIVQQMPVLHRLFINNPVFKIIPHRTADFVKFTKDQVDRRIANYDTTQANRLDLLSHFLEARKTFPEVVTNEQTFIYSLTNVIAGSLSTSHVLDEIVKYLAANPDAQTRVCDEVGLVRGDQTFPIPFDTAKQSPFLEAVILEGARIHNVANSSSERVVGPNGLQLPSGTYLPPGTYVGINAAAMNRRQDVFGEHTDKFDPSRWLRQNETEEDFVNRRLQMDRATVTFGHGSRSCLGKNIVQLELFKILATLCTRYRFHAVGTNSPNDRFQVVVTVSLRDNN